MTIHFVLLMKNYCKEMKFMMHLNILAWALLQFWILSLELMISNTYVDNVVDVYDKDIITINNVFVINNNVSF